jgi:hypothetical protein
MTSSESARPAARKESEATLKTVCQRGAYGAHLEFQKRNFHQGSSDLQPLQLKHVWAHEKHRAQDRASQRCKMQYRQKKENITKDKERMEESTFTQEAASHE